MGARFTSSDPNYAIWATRSAAGPENKVLWSVQPKVGVRPERRARAHVQHGHQDERHAAGDRRLRRLDVVHARCAERRQVRRDDHGKARRGHRQLRLLVSARRADVPGGRPRLEGDPPRARSTTTTTRSTAARAIRQASSTRSTEWRCRRTSPRQGSRRPSTSRAGRTSSRSTSPTTTSSTTGRPSSTATSISAFPRRSCRRCGGSTIPTRSHSDGLNASVGAGGGTLSVTVEPGNTGVQVKITGLTFSRRKLKIKLGHVTPRAPTHVKASRVSGTTARVTFGAARPRGQKVKGYSASCRAPNKLHR